MSSWHSYPKIFNLGHRAVRDLFTQPVIIEEKVDGSQFSFGLINGELRCKSKNREFPADAPDEMFIEGAATVRALANDLHPEWTYRGEYLSKPKHNTLAYERAPERNIIIFDINDDEESYLSPEAKAAEAARIGLECVPVYTVPTGAANLELLQSFLDNTSVLGGQKIEGVVAKSLSLYGEDKKLLMAKHVSEAFKEIHGGEWRKNNPPKADIITALINRFTSPARFQKAVQRLKEDGKLEDSPRDIGALVRLVQEDIHAECADEIKDILYGHSKDTILRGVSRSLPQWYKEQLLARQFDGASDDVA